MTFFIKSETTNIMTYNKAVKIADTYLIPSISELYGLDGYEIKPVKAHDGGRNVVYTCEKKDADAKILRIAFLKDRSREDFWEKLNISGIYTKMAAVFRM